MLRGATLALKNKYEAQIALGQSIIFRNTWL